MMISWIFVMTVICEAVASIQDFPEYYDIGTVLFFPSDSNKLRWSNAEIGLLNARKLLLDVLPPPDILKIQDNYFANSILNYFKDTYNVVKREAKYIECGSLLMTALSDTLGGFMRVWVLPITKLGFYAGTVPQDDALRLFQFYEDIKKYLNTDGKGWHKPNTNFVNFVPANVAPIPVPSPRSSPDPCDALAYFEKTTKGLSIPVPKIIWQEGSESMFVPLKNHTLISLNSPNSSAILFEYYDIAKNCIKSNQIKSINMNTTRFHFEDRQSYDDRLQDWLMTDVIPHLNDEKLYPALRSVLALANKTNTRYDNFMNRYLQFLPTNKKCITGSQSELPSKKMMIITGLILLEMAWCIPTLCYLGCATRKKRRDKGNLYYYVKPKNPLGIWTESTQCNMTVKETRSASTEKSPTDGKKLTSVTQYPETATCKSRTYNIDQATLHSVGTATRSNCKCALCPTVTAKCDHETSPQRSSSKLIHAKKLLDNIALNKMPEILNETELTHENFFGLLNKEDESKTASIITVQELRAMNTTVTVRDNNKPKAKITEIVNYVDETEKTVTTLNKKESKRQTQKVLTCSQDNCKKKQAIQPFKASKKAVKHLDRNDARKSGVSRNSQKDLITFKRGVRLPGKPYLEIIIDRPQRDITVDIGTTKPAQPSKIPKRLSTDTQTQVLQMQSKRVQKYGKSLIPKPKGHGTLDDIIINRNNVSKEVKLNVSL